MILKCINFNYILFSFVSTVSGKLLSSGGSLCSNN